jgi:DNA-binding GntR family transcriptional regulator
MPRQFAAHREIRLPGRQPIADELYEFLRLEIVSGRLEPGERLVEERVARLASVSRTPVREALHKLQLTGLAEASERGMSVAMLSSDQLLDMLAVRENLEGMAAGLAAVRRQAGEIDLLRHVLEEMQTATEAPDLNSLVRITRNFHQVIWQLARNQYLTGLLTSLASRISAVQTTTLAVAGRPQASMVEHAGIAKAIEEQDAEQAEKLTRLHYRHTATAILTMRVSTTAP